MSGRSKIGPMKATLPISVLRGGTGGSLYGNSSNCATAGQRSPSSFKSSSAENSNAGVIRRTASLDTLYIRPTWSIGLVSTVLHLDKSTQTDESYHFERTNMLKAEATAAGSPDIKIEKVIRQRWRSQRGEHSVSSQTLLSPMHGKASPLLIPQRTNSQVHIRPMRSSVEGLNQEIEKLVLFTGQTHSSRNELGLFSRGTPEGHRAPLAELFHNDMRSVNTQTPIGDMLSSDDSHSTSPEDGASVTNASPRINRFLAREPPDGCEKVCLKLTEADQGGTATMFKPCVGFQLRPSLGSAFQPLQPIMSSSESTSALDDEQQEKDEAQKKNDDEDEPSTEQQ